MRVNGASAELSRLIGIAYFNATHRCNLDPEQHTGDRQRDLLGASCLWIVCTKAGFTELSNKLRATQLIIATFHFPGNRKVPYLRSIENAHTTSPE